MVVVVVVVVAVAVAVAVTVLVPVVLIVHTYNEIDYVGCFKDKKKRDLPERKGRMQLSQCAQACSGYAYYGLQHKNQCFCGNSYNNYGESTDCKCDDPDNKGGWVNCVYKQPGTFEYNRDS